MRLGGPLFQNYSDPDTWIAALRERGYRASYCSVDHIDDTLHTYMQAARNAGILIAEVGVWNNPRFRTHTLWNDPGSAVHHCVLHRVRDTVSAATLALRHPSSQASRLGNGETLCQSFYQRICEIFRGGAPA